MPATAESIQREMDLTITDTGEITMTIKIRVAADAERRAYVGGNKPGIKQRWVGQGFVNHPALTAGAIHETVNAHVQELIKAVDKLT
jgi:hypothetical protein